MKTVLSFAQSALGHFAILFAILCVHGDVAHAQVKIGYVDFDQILVNTPRAKVVQAQVEDHERALAATIQQRRSVLEAELRCGSNPVARGDEADWVDQDIRELEADADAEVERLRETLMQPILDEISTVVHEVADDEGYGFVLNSSGVGARASLLVSPPEHDLTAEVLFRIAGH